MACVSFSSPSAEEVIEVQFMKACGGTRSLKLLVDTGFTGRSSIILGADAEDLLRAALPPTETAGALTGPQVRAWVTCQIPALSFQATLIAIVTDLSLLTLPPGVDGMVGLNFLRQFTRWGAERTTQGWHFFLFDRID